MCEWVNTCYKLKRAKKQICNLIDRIRRTRTRSKPSTAGSCLFLPPELVSLFVLWLLVRCDGDTNEEYLLLSWEVGDVSAFEPRWLRSRGVVSMQFAAKTNLISVTNLDASTSDDIRKIHEVSLIRFEHCFKCFQRCAAATCNQRLSCACRTNHQSTTQGTRRSKLLMGTLFEVSYTYPLVA